MHYHNFLISNVLSAHLSQGLLLEYQQVIEPVNSVCLTSKRFFDSASRSPWFATFPVVPQQLLTALPLCVAVLPPGVSLFAVSKEKKARERNNKSSESQEDLRIQTLETMETVFPGMLGD